MTTYQSQISFLLVYEKFSTCRFFSTCVLRIKPCLPFITCVCTRPLSLYYQLLLLLCYFHSWKPKARTVERHALARVLLSSQLFRELWRSQSQNSHSSRQLIGQSNRSLCSVAIESALDNLKKWEVDYCDLKKQWTHPVSVLHKQ